jgi:hypothetical protein
MADNISYIHTNKLAKYNYKYLGKDGTVYIGQKDGRLKKQEVTVIPDGLDVTLAWGNISGDILNQTDLTTYVTNLIAAITLDDLADVVITAPAPGDVLAYDAINNIWINAPAGGGGVTTFSGGTTGLTPVAPTAGAIVLAGTLVVPNGGTGLSTVPTNGQLLIGNGTGYTLSTLTAGAGIGITNAAGSITVSNTSPASGVSVVGRTGDVIVDGTSPNFEVSTVISPFLLMGG